jgi:hypothetical protein
MAGPVDRGVIISAVEKYLASRGIQVSGGGPSCGCDSKPAPVTQSVVSTIAADVVDQFLARRGTSGGQGGFS